MNFYIDVILPLPLDNLFTYEVDQDEAGFLEPGARVAVPFGKTKIYTGIVSKIHNEKPLVYEAKPIEQILDKAPIVTTSQLEFWFWIAKYYMCTVGEVMKAALPGAFLLESETLIELEKSFDLEEANLNDQEYLIVEALQRQSSLKINEVMQLLDKKSVLPVINSMVAKKILIINQEIFQQYKPKLLRYVKLHDRYKVEAEMHQLLDDLSNAPKQREAILTWFQHYANSKKPVLLKTLSKESRVSAAIIKSLIDKDVFVEYHLKTDRIQFDIEEQEQSFKLNEYQDQAFTEIQNNLEEDEVCLLHGVTSSGKTEIYIKCIEKVIAQGKQVLYLLPEIALTSQLVSRLQAYFGEQVLVYHSKYSVNERMEVYSHVLNNNEKAKIVLGARSSIFLPFHDLGMIVVDEEHETTFKQFDPAPRYNARDASIVLANIHKAKVILGSATPSLESYYNATHNKYKLVSLDRRFGNVQLPEIEVVDLQEKYKKKRMTGHFSDRLMEEINLTLEEGEQVILISK